MAKIFLHSDLNNFFASVECLYDPSLRDKPVAVCGNPEARHGIVLAKNMLAKKKGVKTGEALWQAKEKCRDIVFVKPHYDRYLKFSELAQEIYKEYTDLYTLMELMKPGWMSPPVPDCLEAVKRWRMK